MNKSVILLLFLMVLSEYLKAHSSLFFTPDEINRILDNQQTLLMKEKPILSAILFWDESHWVIWINNKPIRSENVQEQEGYSIQRVTPEEVEIVSDKRETLILRLYEIK